MLFQLSPHFIAMKKYWHKIWFLYIEVSIIKKKNVLIYMIFWHLEIFRHLATSCILFYTLGVDMSNILLVRQIALCSTTLKNRTPKAITDTALTLHSTLSGSSLAAPSTLLMMLSPHTGSNFTRRWNGGLFEVPSLFVASQQYLPELALLTPCN